MAQEPSPQRIREERIYRQLGLTDEEYQRAVERLGRLPNYVEAGLFGVLWSEHCSYKSSRVHLKTFPTEGPQVLQGPGENAGVVDIGDGIGIAFKMESHNHPSAVEPYQGAATGVGGILRDVFTMGARPVAFLDSLRFGTLDDARTRYLFEHVVAGIGGYGNCVGIPTVGGEAVFDPIYQHNPLVNAMCVGVLPADRIVKGVASGVGNPVFVIGARTGRDGIHGATFASAEDPQEKERSAVQVGDPFLGKLLMEATLELLATGHVVGVQDMGAAGLTSSSAEMASRAGGGIELYLDRVPVREEGMTPYEMMLSESQERMLVVMEKGYEHLAFGIMAKWGLEIGEIGRVTDDGMLRLYFGGQVVAEVPVTALVDEAPVYRRPVQAPLTPPGAGVPMPAPEADLGQALLRLLGHPNIADKRWIHVQYDTTVRTATQVGPGGDAAVVRVLGTERAVALVADGNGRYVYLNPRRGGAIAVAEAARNIACVGGKPLAITNCLNFGNPEKPEVMFQFAEAIAGMGEACRALDTPVVSGNVSFYNESRGVDIYPTPVVGMVGVIDDPKRVVPNHFQAPGSAVVLLGQPDTALDGSLYWQLAAGRAAGDAPALDLAAERRLVDLLQALARDALVRAAHDVSEGGMAVALAEMAIAGGVGVSVEVEGSCRSAPALTRAASRHDPSTACAGSPSTSDPLVRAGWLFSEAQGRVLVEVAPADVERVLALAEAFGVPAVQIGTTGGARIRVTGGGEVWLDVPLAVASDTYRGALPRALDGQGGVQDAVS
ncbi:MAG: phosphoribosylformylglycinamidine synthase subunit PurL [Alicyclobacillus macrosporangiidus]|uniref:phosphoribosylformylglycinamidine synthase subunit PurL n=1 Tax=Alicyclobacillus macrosporangiidus TaxID=392015 RepID=UPI0026E92A63|nr:phosphoribosylformylglycinamidine synthase subunit PurL [Alicyclobacillus macrosporangiidus]MCL6599458.1 phosphoribosylformylglycinamidine synthase subunit PurL [Alicyclobacillus macrosporangiidus]